MKPRWMTSTGRLVGVAVSRLVRFFDSLGEYVGASSIALGLLAGLLAGGFIRFEMPMNEELIQPHIVAESDPSRIRNPEKRRQAVLLDELAKIRFMEWMGAAPTYDNNGKPLKVSIIVEECDTGSLHRSKTLGKRVVIGGINSLGDVTVGDIINKLPMDLPTIEKPRKQSGDDKRDDADNDATSHIRSGISEDHINSLANAESIHPESKP